MKALTDEEARELGRKELKTIKMMVNNWYISYTKFADGSDWTFLIEDFRKEILEQAAPYVRRLIECGYISECDAAVLFGWINDKEKRLEEELKGSDWVMLSKGGYDG